MYMGSDGVYTHTVPYERDSNCLMCGAGVPMPASDDTTLEQVRPVMHGNDDGASSSCADHGPDLYVSLEKAVWQSWGAQLRHQGAPGLAGRCRRILM